MRIETKSVHRVDYGDLERKIQEEWGFPYEMPCDMECGNDTSHEFDGITKAQAIQELQEDTRLMEWVQSQGRKQMWGPRTFLLEMVRRDIIPEGDYIITVSW